MTIGKPLDRTITTNYVITSLLRHDVNLEEFKTCVNTCCKYLEENYNITLSGFVYKRLNGYSFEMVFAGFLNVLHPCGKFKTIYDKRNGKFSHEGISSVFSDYGDYRLLPATENRVNNMIQSALGAHDKIARLKTLFS